MSFLAKSSLLVCSLVLCAIAVVVIHVSRRSVSTPAPHELYSVVNGQLAAFRASDFSRAYGVVARDAQQKISREEFEVLVRRKYPAMTQKRRVEFGLVRVDGSSAVVPVLIFAADGRAEAFLYNLVAEAGAWKIEGVERVKLPAGRERRAGLRS